MMEAVLDEGATGPRRAPLDDAERGRVVAELFDAHHDAVWRTLRRLGVSDALADDAAQRVFLVAARRLEDIREGEESRYLYGIALRVASEVRRRDPSRREVSDEAVLACLRDDAPGPEERLADQEARDVLDEVLAAMPDDLRDVLVLVELEGLTVDDVATLQGIPTGTAASRLRRAREAFHASARRARARLERVGIAGATRVLAIPREGSLP